MENPWESGQRVMIPEKIQPTIHPLAGAKNFRPRGLPAMGVFG